jgi:hypothetical protein
MMNFRVEAKSQTRRHARNAIQLFFFPVQCVPGPSYVLLGSPSSRYHHHCCLHVELLLCACSIRYRAYVSIGRNQSRIDSSQLSRSGREKKHHHVQRLARSGRTQEGKRASDDPALHCGVNLFASFCLSTNLVCCNLARLQATKQSLDRSRLK